MGNTGRNSSPRGILQPFWVKLESDSLWDGGKVGWELERGRGRSSKPRKWVVALVSHQEVQDQDLIPTAMTLNLLSGMQSLQASVSGSAKRNAEICPCRRSNVIVHKSI